MSIKVYTVTLDDDAGVNTQAFWHEEDADIYHALLIGELWWRHRETIPTALDPYEVYEDLSCSAGYFDWVRIEAIEPCNHINSNEARVRIVCATCGSANVRRDAWAEWDEEKQDWYLGTVFDAGHCEDCEGEARLKEEPLP